MCVSTLCGTVFRKSNEVMEFADAGDLQHLLKGYLGLWKIV